MTLYSNTGLQPTYSIYFFRYMQSKRHTAVLMTVYKSVNSTKILISLRGSLSTVALNGQNYFQWMSNITKIAVDLAHVEGSVLWLESNTWLLVDELSGVKAAHWLPFRLGTAHLCVNRFARRSIESTALQGTATLTAESLENRSPPSIRALWNNCKGTETEWFHVDNVYLLHVM